MKKTVLHIITNLGRGGAETMLAKVLEELSDYNNIVVTLFPLNHFGDELKCDKYICLHIRSILFLPFSVFRLRNIIKKYKVDIVHSHLFWPTMLARIATPKRIPLVTTIHAFIATSIEYKKWYIRFLDKFTFRIRKNAIIAVAKGAEEEYFDFLKLKPYKAFTLYTFYDPEKFNYNKTQLKNSDKTIFKLITVGALRQQKNHKFLLEAFKQLDNKDYQLDIYGAGELHGQLFETIKQYDLNVNLKGAVRNLENIINEYDLFVMSSTYEGFSLSVLEAMAMQMPVLLSDIKSFREQCENTAIYFDLSNVNDFVVKLKKLVTERNCLKEIGMSGYERAINNFTLSQHMNGLRNIYQSLLK